MNSAGVVWSSDKGRVCPNCGNAKDKCSCSQSKSKSNIADTEGVVRIFRDKKARKGKQVTVITDIPLNDKELKKYAKFLKQKCGAGGTIKDNSIEIQGDFRDKIFEILQKEGWTVKKVGG